MFNRYILLYHGVVLTVATWTSNVAIAVSVLGALPLPAARLCMFISCRRVKYKLI